MLNKKYIFIRNDDVYKLDDKLIEFCSLCLREKVPVIYTVIPGRVERPLADFLIQKKRSYPRQLDIVQHGWRHKNYSLDLKNKYEFGPERDHQQQKRDIIKGLNRLTVIFAKFLTSAFVPPYNGCDLNTLKIINDLNFSIFSGGKKTLFKDKKFLDLPCQVSLNGYTQNGKPLPLSLDGMIRNFVSNRARSSILGISFHHRTLNPYSFEALSKFISLLKKLKEKGEIDFILFSEILKRRWR